ncbi:MAG: phosphoenolpyruvate--protein phosphotransferase [Anaerolineales bacterium]
MVGLVIVSHSRELAKALVKLLQQVTTDTLPVSVAAGVGENRQEFGTNAVEIMQAIQSVFSEDGVLVLMDLGSAVMSAEMALELLPPDMRAKIRFCAAPLVEGAIAAAVQIGLGSDVDAVCREANAALEPKRQQIGQDAAEPMPAQPFSSIEKSESITLTLTNLHGLHARPAAKFVQTAARFKADIHVTNLTLGKGPVSARSLNALATLGAIENHQIRIDAAGPESAQALDTLRALAESNFGEAAAGQTTTEPPTETTASPEGGLPISEGIACAPLFRYQQPLPPLPDHRADNPSAEWKRLEDALALTAQEITRRARQLQQTIGPQESAIFDAHLLILQDPSLLAATHARIFNQYENAAQAWHTVIKTTAQGYRDLSDPYLQTRATDVEDVGRQVLFCLADKSIITPLTFEQPVILFANDLTPTETSQLDMNLVLGIITSGGGPTSHSAILARALGIPAVAGTGTLLEHVQNGTLVGIDGSSGKIWLNPSPNVLAELQARREEWVTRRTRLKEESQNLAVTQDGKRIEVFANLGGITDVWAAIENGAEGCGLLRTEFLFLTRETAPSEEEQYLLLRQIYESMGPNRPVTTRTLDVGGDKALPYIQLPEEPNPFLGVRALRLSLTRPDLFLPQLRAILRAANGLPCRIMFPMVADIEEIRQARYWLECAHDELSQQNMPHAWPVEMGIMVEIPSAALLSPLLAREVDFFSIGTNDLTQYTLAAERGSPSLARLADGLHPAVLRLIKTITDAAHSAGKWTGVCGELGGDPEAVPILVGLGVDELSLNPAGIPRIKSIIRNLTLDSARSLAEQALACATSAEVRVLVNDKSLLLGLKSTNY